MRLLLLLGICSLLTTPVLANIEFSCKQNYAISTNENGSEVNVRRPDDLNYSFSVNEETLTLPRTAETKKSLVPVTLYLDELNWIAKSDETISISLYTMERGTLAYYSYLFDSGSMLQSWDCSISEFNSETNN